MTTSLSSPPVFPDDILLDKNSTTGALQLKPATQGNLLYAGASGVWAALATGTAGYYLKSNGAGANPSWSAGTGEGWSLIETLSPSAVSTISSTGTLTVYDEYLVIMATTSSASNFLYLQFNGDTGANYAYIYVNGGTAVATNVGQTYLWLFDANTTIRNLCALHIQGKTPAVASSYLQVAISQGKNVGANLPFAGNWLGGNNTQITSMTWTANSGNFTGTIQIYGRNRS